MNDSVIEMIKRHEGFRALPYRCPSGRLTIGYGLNLEAGISEAEADYLLRKRLERLEKLLQHYPWFVSLDEARKGAVLDMAYNLGLAGFLKFRKLIGHLASREWEEAAKEALDSLWATQVGRRAIEIAQIIREGRLEEGVTRV